jgi:hypothetical protein
MGKPGGPPTCDPYGCDSKGAASTYLRLLDLFAGLGTIALSLNLLLGKPFTPQKSSLADQTLRLRMIQVCCLEGLKTWRLR